MKHTLDTTITLDNIKYIYINKYLICLNNIPKNINTLADIIDNLNLLILIQNKNNNKNNTKYNTNFYNYYILHNNKLISKNTNINNFITNYNSNNKNNKNNNIIYLDIIERQCGGDVVSDIFNVILDIGELFMSIIEILKWLGNFIWWLLQFIKWLFFDLLNPIKFANEFFISLITIVITVCRIPFDIILALFAFSVNILGGWMQGFWGWDQSSLTDKDRESNYFKKIDRSKNKKCYLTNTNTVPFSIILGTILCPPIGVFMDMGVTGWLNILICILLTLLFYLPGLAYALLIIYS